MKRALLQQPHPAELSDAELARRIAAGDTRAFEGLMRRHNRALFRTARAILRDDAEAEDALQETFVQAIRHADAVSPGAFRGWLFTVAHRQAMLAKRKARRLPVQVTDSELLSLVADEPAEGVSDRADDARAVRELLELLPPPQRAVIAARVFEGKKFREVAADLGCPLNTALARMHDGLKKLRQLWEARYA